MEAGADAVRLDRKWSAIMTHGVSSGSTAGSSCGSLCFRSELLTPSRPWTLMTAWFCCCEPVSDVFLTHAHCRSLKIAETAKVFKALFFVAALN